MHNVGYYASPAFADLDNDGDYDLLIGEWNVTTFAYKNTGSDSFFSIGNNGNVGIGITNSKATLDVNGFIKLKLNSSVPSTCNSTTKGSIALTSATKMCICNGSNWVFVNTTTTCTW